MAQVKDNQQSHHQQQAKSKNNLSQSAGDKASQAYKTPMIIERVNKLPMVSLAVTMGFSQYDKLKSSNVYVGDIMTKAENWATFLWQKAQPIVEKLQEPIHKVDQLACQTFDYVETKIGNLKT